MTNPLQPAPYGADPYPNILRVIVPSTVWGPGWSSHNDINLATFPLDSDGAPDPAAIQDYIEASLLQQPALEFQIIVRYGPQFDGTPAFPNLVSTTEGVIDGIDAINGYLGTTITSPTPPA